MLDGPAFCQSHPRTDRCSTVERGATAYGPSFEDLARRAATYVDQILKGASPADLPIERPPRLDFVISLKAAGRLGLTIPRSVLEQATQVIS